MVSAVLRAIDIRLGSPGIKFHFTPLPASLPLILKGRVSMWEASFEFMSDERSVCGLLFTAPLGSFGEAVFLSIISDALARYESSG